MSELRATTISDLGGTGPVTLTGQYASKAWVNFNGTGTIATRDSFNVSSLLDNGTGDYTISFTNGFDAADYGATGLAGGSSGLPTAGQSAPREGGIYSTIQIQTSNFYPGTNSAKDHGVCFYALIGDLA